MTKTLRIVVTNLSVLYIVVNDASAC